MKQWWDAQKERLTALFEEYGKVAIGTYIVIAVGTLVGFAIAIEMGVEVEGVAADVGTFGAAFAGYKLVMPVRIAAPCALTPLIAAVVRRIEPRRAEQREAPRP